MADFSIKDKAAMVQKKASFPLVPPPEDIVPVSPDEFCEGGHRLHEGPHVPGAPGQQKCKEGFEPKYDEFFVKPCKDSKVFSGEVMTWDKFREWRERILSLKWEGTVRGDTCVVQAERILLHPFHDILLKTLWFLDS